MNFNTDNEAFKIKIKCLIRLPKNSKTVDSRPSSSEGDSLNSHAMVTLAPDQAKDLARLMDGSTKTNRTKVQRELGQLKTNIQLAMMDEGIRK